MHLEAGVRRGAGGSWQQGRKQEPPLGSASA